MGAQVSECRSLSGDPTPLFAHTRNELHPQSYRAGHVAQLVECLLSMQAWSWILAPHKLWVVIYACQANTQGTVDPTFKVIFSYVANLSPAWNM